MAKFLQLWSQLERDGGTLPLLLIDCAGLKGGHAQIPVHIFSELKCLFAGDLGDELADVGPYLGQLASFGSEAAEHAESLIKSQVASLILPKRREAESYSFSEVHRHFRKFNVVYGPNGEPMFFRYYDPRTLANLVDVLARSQLDQIFAPVEGYVVFNADEEFTLCRHTVFTLARV